MSIEIGKGGLQGDGIIAQVDCEPWERKNFFNVGESSKNGLWKGKMLDVVTGVDVYVMIKVDRQSRVMRVGEGKKLETGWRSVFGTMRDRGEVEGRGLLRLGAFPQ